MLKNLINKIMYRIYYWSKDYLYRNVYIPKHCDKDFWGDDEL